MEWVEIERCEGGMERMKEEWIGIGRALLFKRLYIFLHLNIKYEIIIIIIRLCSYSSCNFNHRFIPTRFLSDEMRMNVWRVWLATKDFTSDDKKDSVMTFDNLRSYGKVRTNDRQLRNDASDVLNQSYQDLDKVSHD